MSKRSDKDLVEDMLEAISRIQSYCEGLEYPDFLSDIKTQDAVVRNIEILGEAAKKVSTRIQVETSEIPWRSVAGMRDRLIHDYFGVNWDIIWSVVTSDLADLDSKLKKLRGKLLSNEENR